MEHRKLPTKSFLTARISNAVVDKYCLICKQNIEDQQHILWDCSFAKKIWEMVLEWWGINNKFHLYTSFNLWEWLKWFTGKSIKIGWGVVIASTLWSLWLNHKWEFLRTRCIKLRS